MILLLAVIVARPAAGQLALGPLQINGSVGVSGRGYAASGIANRRTPLVGEVFARAGFNLYGLSSGLNLNYSTESSRLRQRMNRIGFNTSWTWGRASAGDVSPTFSQYSLRGVTLRGGSVELHPGNLAVALAMGQSQRPVEFLPQEGFRGASFRRMLYAGRIGYGSQRSTHVHLGAVYGRDLRSSIDDSGDLAPKENLNLVPAFGLSLFEGRLYVKGEVAFSAFTPDARASALEKLELPGFLTQLFTPRIGTFASYAGGTDVRLSLDRFDVQASYSRVQPGFASLGLGRLRSDQQRFRIAPQVRLFGRRLALGLNYSQSHNNLLDQLVSTLMRRQIGAQARARVDDHISISAQYMRQTNRNVPGKGAEHPLALQQLQVAQTFMLSPTLILPAGEYTHSMTLSGSYQLSADRSNAVRQGVRPGFESRNATGTLSYGLRFPSGFAVHATGNFLRGNSAHTMTQILGLNLSTGLNLLDQRLTLSLDSGWSNSHLETSVAGGNRLSRSMQFSGGLGAAYRPTTRDSFRFRLRGLRSIDRTAAGASFNEMRGSVHYQHRF